MDFFTEGSFMDSYLASLNVLMMDLFNLLSSQMLTDGLEIIVMFLSDSHSDGTHSLQSIHCWASAAFLQPDEETNSSTWMTWVHFQQMFIFGWTIALIDNNI